MAMLFSMSPVGTFLRWWGSELRGLIPGQSTNGSQQQSPRFVVSLESATYRVLEFTNGRPTAAGSPSMLSRDELLERLAQRSRAKKLPPLWLRLHYSSCYVRRVELPAAAGPNADKLLALDLERNSPFLPADIRAAHYQDRVAARAGHIGFQQLIVKRASVDHLVVEIERRGIEVGGIDCWNEDGTASLPVNFLAVDREPLQSFRFARTMVAALVVTALGLAASATYVVVDKHETALRDIRSQTALLKAKSRKNQETLAKSQEQFDEFAKLRRLRADYLSKAQTLNDLTRLVPDTAWVNDLRLDGNNLDFTGLAASAANLVRSLERSTTFVDATMTSPLTFDQREDKERFSLRARLRNVAASTVDRVSEPRE